MKPLKQDILKTIGLMLTPTRWKRIIFFLIMDASIIAGSLFTAFLLRFEFVFPTAYVSAFWAWLIGLTAIKILVLLACGLYNINWRFVGVTELKNILKCLVVVVLVMLTGNALTRQYMPRWDIPYSIIVIDSLLSFGLMAFLRISKRLYVEFLAPNRKKKPTLIVGINYASERAIRELKGNPGQALWPVAIVDDSKERQRTWVDGIPVADTLDGLEEIIIKLRVETVLISMPNASRQEIQDVFSRVHQAGVNDVKIVPKVSEYDTQLVKTNSFKDIEISDLLFRDAVKIEDRKIKEDLREKVVLVTGAAGSIGSEIVRQLLSFQVKRIIALDIGETEIYDLQFEINKVKKPGQTISFVVGDVRDPEKMEHVFARYKPQMVFHAAAYKHVPLMNSYPEEAVRTNIFGAANLARTAVRHKVDKFVNISTDKAVNPASFMGVTKRVAEMVCSSLNGNGTKFISVRFGNVLGSRGSVIPLFLKQIADGGPVTVTHPEMKRYFMSIPEAVSLVLQAAHMGKGGEVFVLDMGEPVKIIDLARRLIELNNLTPGEDIAIEFSQVRPGEKLFEELLTAEEGTIMTRHQKIFVARNGKVNSSRGLDRVLKKLEKNLYSPETITALIKEVVPAFRPRDVH